MKKISLASLIICALINTVYAAAPTATATAMKTTIATPAAPVVVAPPAHQMLNRIIAIVNDQVITQMQLNSAIAQTNLQIEQSGQTPPSDDQFKQQVLQQLILQTVALQLASTNNITVSDDAVTQAINGLLTQNNATLDQLKQALATAGVSYDNYRNTIRSQLIITQLEQKAVAGTIMITPQEIDDFMAARAKLPNQNAEYDVSHILITLPNNPTPAVIAQYKAKAQHIVDQLNQHQITFSKAAMEYSAAGDAMQGGDLGLKTLNQLPTLFVNEVIHMQPQQVVGPLQDANGFHIITLNSVQTPAPQQHFVTQYHVQVILVKTNPVVDDDRAEATLNDIKAAIQNGKSFAQLAKDNSQDPDTRASGGDMGWKSLAELDPAVSSAVKSLPLNTVSAPFKVSGGWEILEVTGQRQKDDTQNFIRQQAAETLFRQKAENALQTWQDKILGESYVHILVPSLRPSSN